MWPSPEVACLEFENVYLVFGRVCLEFVTLNFGWCDCIKDNVYMVYFFF